MDYHENLFYYHHLIHNSLDSGDLSMSHWAKSVKGIQVLKVKGLQTWSLPQKLQVSGQSFLIILWALRDNDVQSPLDFHALHFVFKSWHQSREESL